MVAHELGHAFGLYHDFRDESYIMSYGAQRARLSACHAEFLAVHTYFNPNSPIGRGSWPTIAENTSSPIYTAGVTSIPIRSRVRDPDGLHQVILFAKTKKPHPGAGTSEVKECRGLEGERDAVVEFDYDGVIPSFREFDSNIFKTQHLRIEAIDALGNVASSRLFELVNNRFRGPISTLSISRVGFISSMFFFPDGRLLALQSFYSRDRVKLWDVSTGKSIATLPLPALDIVHAEAFSPDGRLLASLSGGTIEVWDVSSRKRVTTISAHKEAYGRALSFSPDGRLLASVGSRRERSDDIQNSEVKLWDVSTGEPIATLLGSGPVSFSPDGRLLASASARETKYLGFGRLFSTTGGQTVKLWDVSTGEPIATLPVLDNVLAVAFSPDGRRLAAGAFTTVTLWDVPEWTRSSGQVITDDEAMPQTLTKVSGDGQRGLVGTALAAPFVVSVLDQNGSAFAGAVVTFSVTAGGGTMSSATGTTDARGRARSTLTLGSQPGPNTVKATVAGLDSVTFTATATEQAPHRLTKVSGEGQAGPASTQLAAPFVVSVLDQDGEAFAGAVVTFTVTAGGGLLSSTTDDNPCTVESSTSSATATTDANGQAATRLTLGSEPGPNTVSATVEGLASATFTATAAEQAMPHRLTKVCGDDQEGTVGILLAEPFVVSVLDEEDAAITGVVVSFSVTAGGGTLSSATATTDANGRAATRLTLGDEPGPNTALATVEGLTPVTFTATGEESPLASLFDLFNQSGKLAALPDRTQLLQNAPNPFNSETVLSYFLLEPGSVRLEVFALSGQRVAVLHQGPQRAGYHRLHWDGRDDAGHPVASGAYLYRLVTDEAVLTRKLILLR